MTPLNTPEKQYSNVEPALPRSVPSAEHPPAGPRPLAMILIPGGPFRMGSNHGSPAERPEHTVDLPDFWIDATPVTNRAFAEFARQAQYRTEMEQAGSAWGFSDGRFQNVPGLSWRSFATPDREDHPVVLVTWHDANAFCRWAGGRLPTEAEWEKAARGGLHSAAFPWGDSTPDGAQSNFARQTHGLPGTLPVQSHAPNALGLFDMVGNVWQWCSDWYGETSYSEGHVADPQGPQSGTTRVRRGGAWNVIQPFRLRCSNRGAMLPSQTATNVGFRCARSR